MAAITYLIFKNRGQIIDFTMTLLICLSHKFSHYQTPLSSKQSDKDKNKLISKQEKKKS